MSATTRPGEFKNVYRFGAFALALAVGITALSSQMFLLQVVQNQVAAQLGGPDQGTQKQSVAPTRGLIYAADGQPLVKNVVDYQVTVTPSDLPLNQEQLVAQRLGSVLNLDPIYIETQIDSATGSLDVPVRIADGVTADVARFIEENADQLPGTNVVVTQKREYLTQNLFSDIIGYEGQITAAQYKQLQALGYSSQDIVGQAGLENYYEQDLRGTPGTQTVAVDSAGKPIPGLVNQGTKPIPGDSLTLNISTVEQQNAYKALSWGLQQSKVTRGVIIVENPQNGKILAMVSLPTYNDQLFADGISETDFQNLLSNPDQPLVNKAVGSQYAPGSTFKLVTGTAGLQDQSACQGGSGSLAFDYCSTGTFDNTTRLLSQP